MSEQRTQERMSRGARVSRRDSAARVPPVPPPVRRINDEALALAYANKHKPWARRWLKANGRWA